MPNFPEKKAVISIPNPYGPSCYDPHGKLTHQEYQVFEITPLTDEWLVHPDRTVDEVDEALESRLAAIQINLQAEGNNPSKEQFGISTPLSDTHSRLFAYVELLDEYHVAIDSWQSLTAQHESTYQAEKARLQGLKERKVIRSGKCKNEVLKAREVCDSNLRRLAEKSEISNQLSQLILRKAVLELLEVSPDGYNLFLAQLPNFLEKTRQDSQAGETVDFPIRFSERNATSYFIQEMASFLQTSDDPYLFATYRYKSMPGPISRMSDCQLLIVTAQMALEPETYSPNPGNQAVLSSLGHGFLSFLINRAEYLSKSKTTQELEQYPITTLIYDLVSALTAHGRNQLMVKMAVNLDEKLLSSVGLPPSRKEMQSLSEKFATLLAANFREVDLLADYSPLTPPPAGVMESIARKISEVYRTPEWRLMNGLMTLRRILRRHAQDSPWGNFQIPKTLLSHTIEPFTNAFTRYTTEQQRKDLYLYNMVLKQFGSLGLASLKEFEVDLGTILASTIYGNGKTEYYNEQREEFSSSSASEKNAALVELYQDLLEDGEYKSDFTLIINFFSEYAAIFWQGTDLESLSTIEKQNHFLWGEVLDNQIWFVSPRGDRFIASRESELQVKGIDSVTFQINPQRPREHLVELRLAGVHPPLCFWLDIHRNFLFSPEPTSPRGLMIPLGMEPSAQQGLLNLILRRLYAITSGAYKGGEEIKPGAGARADTRETEYKRAHYRRYDNPPFTLESLSAIMHAEEIRQKYGIDIYQEMERRWQIGTLPPNKTMTFVKEVFPPYKEGDVQPNILIFDPSLITTPY